MRRVAGNPLSNKRKGRKGKARKNIYPIDKARGKQEATLDIEIAPEFQAGAARMARGKAPGVIQTRDSPKSLLPVRCAPRRGKICFAPVRPQFACATRIASPGIF